jgi:hypothetical protein
MRNLRDAWPLLVLGAYFFLIGWLVYHPPGFSLYMTGAGNEPGRVYGFWSGFGGSLLFSAAVLFPPWYYQHTCHDHFSCLRWGKHPAAGGTFKLCWRHHPDMGTRPHRALIHRMHAEWKRGIQK